MARVLKARPAPTLCPKPVRARPRELLSRGRAKTQPRYPGIAVAYSRADRLIQLLAAEGPHNLG
jgi:hypothetical protein